MIDKENGDEETGPKEIYAVVLQVLELAVI